MIALTYTALLMRVVFARGSLARLGEEVARLGCARPFVIDTAGSMPTSLRWVGSPTLENRPNLDGTVEVEEGAAARKLRGLVEVVGKHQQGRCQNALPSAVRCFGERASS